MRSLEAPEAKTGAARPGRRRLTRQEMQSLTRRRLIDAAAEVFGEKGFRQAALIDVADRAGYTIGAVYSNFSSKDDLFLALMRERLLMMEGMIAAGFPVDEQADPSLPMTVDERITRELDWLAAGEDSVAPHWWRLLAEFRAHAATDPAVWAELTDTERRCRELVARGIEQFAASIGLVLPLPAIQLAELQVALTDGLRAAHATGRSSLTSGQGLRLVVAALIDRARRGTDAA